MLGNLTPDQFLRVHWQRQPLLVRAALKDYVAPLSVEELAGLTLEPEVESRLISNGDATAPWPVRFGPFSEQDFARLPKTDWTLLVQAVDLWCPEVANFMRTLTFCHAGVPMT